MGDSTGSKSSSFSGPSSSPVVEKKTLKPQYFRPGFSGNPSGRAKVNKLFQNRSRKAVDEFVLDAWINEVKTKGPNWLKASKLLVQYGYGKPTQQIDVIVKAKTLSDLIREAGEPKQIEDGTIIDAVLVEPDDEG